jgi:hypothetical protein
MAKIQNYPEAWGSLLELFPQQTFPDIFEFLQIID